MTHPIRLSALALIAAACTSSSTRSVSSTAPSATKVGPPKGSVIVVGGGGQGPEVFAKMIELAGGPDALILDVPTAGGDTAYPPNWRGQNGLRAAGARNVVVLHTSDRKVADSDAFVEVIKKAKGIWFEGGRHFHLVDSYLGTKTEYEFNQVLARGGVVAGSSAGASILGSFLVRGAPSNNNMIMAYPGYLKGFAYLRGTGIDQHVVARDRLADLADSLAGKYRDTLFISEDEGTAWVVQGDEAEIIGRNKAFVYNGNDATDPGKPFLTLFPGDRYNLASRHVIRRAYESTPLTPRFVDDVLASLPKTSQAQVVVAQRGKVYVAKGYNIPVQRKFAPETSVPNFALGDVGDVLRASVFLGSMRPAAPAGGGGRGGRGNAAAPGQGSAPAPAPPLALTTPLGSVTVREYLSHTRDVPDGSRAFAQLVARHAGQSFSQLVGSRIGTPVGMQRVVADSNGGMQASADALYRFEQGLNTNRNFTEGAGTNVFAPVNGGATGNALGWRVDSYKGSARQAAYGTKDGKQNAYVRFPEQGAAIIILTNDANADAKGMAERIADKLFSK